MPFPDSHDDYIRWITFSHILTDFGRIGSSLSADDANRIPTLCAEWMIFAHKAAFGCKPDICPECSNVKLVQRALNCDKHGNPLDGGFFRNAAKES